MHLFLYLCDFVEKFSGFHFFGPWEKWIILGWTVDCGVWNLDNSLKLGASRPFQLASAPHYQGLSRLSSGILTTAGREMTGREMSDREMSGREMSGREMSITFSSISVSGRET